MKKYIIITLLCVSMSLFAQTGNEFYYAIDEIAVQEVQENGLWKEERTLNILNNEIQFHVVRDHDRIIVLSGFEQPLMIAITSEYQRAQGIVEYRGIDINGASVSCIINMNNGNMFFVVSPVQRMRFHVRKYYNIAVRKFPQEGRHKKLPKKYRTSKTNKA